MARMQIPWYIAAFGAALMWGIHYPLVDNALRKVSLPMVLLISSVPILLVIPFTLGQLAHDLRVLTEMGWRERLPVLALGLTSLAGAVFLFFAIGSKNATLASLIEISYPVFVALFAFLLFRQIQINASVVVGALLVFAGVAVIILNNR